MNTRRLHAHRLGAITLAALLAACGGKSDDPAPTSAKVSGLVADGPLQGATACYDLNDNAACDTGEPQATTDADGRYSFDVANADLGQHAVIVAVPATAVDKDSGAAVGQAFTLKAPPTGTNGAQSVFVSPLTTLVVDLAADQGLTRDEAVSRVQGQLGLTASPLADFVSTPDPQAKTLASTVNRVILDVTALATSANVPAAEAQALVRSVTLGNLAGLAAFAASATGSTPAEIAAAASAQVLADRNLSAGTVAEQAQTVYAIATTPAAEAAATGPFVSVRRFTWSSAADHRLQAFVGDSTPGSDGNYLVSETRVTRVAGVDQPFNRNTVYWSPEQKAWAVCDNQWQIIRVTPATASTPQISLFCGASTTRTRTTERDIAGRRMADVVAEVRASSLADAPGFDTNAAGLPTAWGPTPTALGDAVFGEGAKLTLREATNEVGNTDRYSLTDKPQVRPPSGIGAFVQMTSLDELKRMPGNFTDPTAVVTNTNTVFVDDLPFDQPNAALRPVKRYRMAVDPASGKLRFFRCDVLVSTNASQNCEAVGDGDGAATALGDAQVDRVTSGYPAALTTALQRQRIWIERQGVVWGGYRDLERKVFQYRLNTAGWNQLRTALGMAEPPAPQPPAGPGPFKVLRGFTFADAQNWSARVLEGNNSQVDANGDFAVDDVRRIVTAGAVVPFARNALYWTGSTWYDCPLTGDFFANIAAPFTSRFCGTYIDERASNSTVTLAGRTMTDVVNDIRLYPTRDGAFSYANWGPNPAVQTQLATTVFPAGATMEYRGNTRKATPVGISTAATSRVRVPPADASVPFDTWPFAVSLDEFVTKYPGDLKGGALNGATAFFVAGSTLPTAPAADRTTTVQIRVAFDATGQKARFYRNYISATTGFTTDYVALLDTTYTVETLGDAKVLKFAAMPAGFEDDFAFQRMYAERAGSVWYAFKDSIPAQPMMHIRLNGIAADALATALGISF